MVRTTITLPTALLEELRPLVGARSKTRAVLIAVEDEIRLRKLERIKAAAGRLKFTASAKELRHADKRLG